MKLIIRLGLMYVVFLGLGLILLWLSFSIPSESLKKQVKSSLDTFVKEGTYPLAGWYPRQIVLDNFTDSIMVNTAYSVTDNSWRSILLAERQILSTSEVDQIKNLQAAYENRAPVRSSYERYWHGYLVWLRPLLALRSYEQIRRIIGAVLWLLLGLLLWQVTKTRGLAAGIALMAGLMMTDFGFIGNSIQFSQNYIIGMIAGLCLLRAEDRKQIIVYFAAGMATVFFDLLTAPLVTLGILLIVTKPTGIKRLGQLVGSWVVGYGLMGISKWVITAMLLNRDSLSDAWGHVINRTVHPADAEFSQLKTLYLNIAQLIGYARLSQIILVGIGLLGVVLVIWFRKKTIEMKLISYWAAAGLLPYFWYVFAANHAYIHVWFTYRNQLLTVAAMTMIYIEWVDWRKLKNIWKIGAKILLNKK